jgi:hypothetical protein
MDPPVSLDFLDDPRLAEADDIVAALESAIDQIHLAQRKKKEIQVDSSVEEPTAVLAAMGIEDRGDIFTLNYKPTCAAHTIEKEDYTITTVLLQSGMAEIKKMPSKFNHAPLEFLEVARDFQEFDFPNIYDFADPTKPPPTYDHCLPLWEKMIALERVDLLTANEFPASTQERRVALIDTVLNYYRSRKCNVWVYGSANLAARLRQQLPDSAVQLFVDDNFDKFRDEAPAIIVYPYAFTKQFAQGRTIFEHMLAGKAIEVWGHVVIACDVFESNLAAEIQTSGPMADQIIRDGVFGLVDTVVVKTPDGEEVKQFIHNAVPIVYEKAIVGASGIAINSANPVTRLFRIHILATASMEHLPQAAVNFVKKSSPSFVPAVLTNKEAPVRIDTITPNPSVPGQVVHAPLALHGHPYMVYFKRGSKVGLAVAANSVVKLHAHYGVDFEVHTEIPSPADLTLVAVYVEKPSAALLKNDRVWYVTKPDGKGVHRSVLAPWFFTRYDHLFFTPRRGFVAKNSAETGSLAVFNSLITTVPRMVSPKELVVKPMAREKYTSSVPTEKWLYTTDRKDEPALLACSRLLPMDFALAEGIKKEEQWGGKTVGPVTRDYVCDKVAPVRKVAKLARTSLTPDSTFIQRPWNSARVEAEAQAFSNAIKSVLTNKVVLTRTKRTWTKIDDKKEAEALRKRQREEEEKQRLLGDLDYMSQEAAALSFQQFLEQFPAFTVSEKPALREFAEKYLGKKRPIDDETWRLYEFLEKRMRDGPDDHVEVPELPEYEPLPVVDDVVDHLEPSITSPSYNPTSPIYEDKDADREPPDEEMPDLK